MAGKSSQPALYEKMRNRANEGAPVSPKIDLHPAAVQTGPADHAGGSWLSPGRAIRLPTGYVLLACGLAVLLLSVAYVLGHKRGNAVARTQFEQHVIDNASPAVNDPLNPLQPLLNGTSGVPSGANQPNSARNDGGASVRANPVSSWGTVMPAKDPRQKGLNYYVLAETRESGAKQLAEFCRSKGLETYVLSGKNNLLRVVAFPGFPGKDISSDQVQALKAQIQQVGEQWAKVKGSAGDNLHGFYAVLYNG